VGVGGGEGVRKRFGMTGTIEELLGRDTGTDICKRNAMIA
jgi:hypothetical protein